ncbi:hypothetical protein AAVH_42317, partial [Aphelenchoides avenae]
TYPSGKHAQTRAAFACDARFDSSVNQLFALSFRRSVPLPGFPEFVQTVYAILVPCSSECGQRIIVENPE